MTNNKTQPAPISEEILDAVSGGPTAVERVMAQGPISAPTEKGIIAILPNAAGKAKGV